MKNYCIKLEYYDIMSERESSGRFDERRMPIMNMLFVHDIMSERESSGRFDERRMPIMNMLFVHDIVSER